MDRFSFLNAAHSQLIEDLYQQYLKSRGFFRSLHGKPFFISFDFPRTTEMTITSNTSRFGQHCTGTADLSQAVAGGEVLSTSKVNSAVNLIEAYRTRGHLYQNQSGKRKKTLYTYFRYRELVLLKRIWIQKFNCAVETGMKEPATLADLIKHLENIYCDSFG